MYLVHNTLKTHYQNTYREHLKRTQIYLESLKDKG